MARASILAARALLVLAGACAQADPPTSVLLLTLDTTDPTALGCYGNPGGLTPNLDRLAREGILFENARSVAPLTLAAHASILTGLYPLRHSIRRNGETVLPSGAVTLAERASDAGFQTAAITAAVVLAPEFGLTQGFAHYDAPATPASVQEHLAASRPASEVAERALRWLADRDRARPFLLWLHFYDPHFPYAPPPEARRAAGGDDYLGEVAAMDKAIGRVLDALESEGALERTLVLAVADHGEGRGRHGEKTHGAFVFDSTLRIPLIARLPGHVRAGERFRGFVSQVDVLPMLLATLGLPGVPDIDGRDPLAGGDRERGAYFESYFGTNSFGWSPVAGWADAHGKYVHSSAPELYDLVRDPGELRDRIAELPEEAEHARAILAELARRPRLHEQAIDDEHVDLQREIERLGYSGVGSDGEGDPEPLAASALPSPHRMVQAYADYMNGRELLEEHGDREEAAHLLERAVRTNPGNHKAWFTLGLVRQDMKRFDEAADAFERAAGQPGGERIPAELNLAVCLYNLGRRSEAIRRLDLALRDTAGPPGALELLVQMLEEEGRTAEAEHVRLRLVGRSSP